VTVLLFERVCVEKVVLSISILGLTIGVTATVGVGVVSACLLSCAFAGLLINTKKRPTPLRLKSAKATSM
jgi:hypothetical protein